MSINWEWFEEHFKAILIILLVIWTISKIDLWINGTEKSTFLIVLSPSIKSLFGDFILLLALLLLGVFYQIKEKR